MNTRLLGVDTGGTFTDFVYFDGRMLHTHKVLSSPATPEKAILQGLQEMGLVLESLRLVHGSTVATNALLEAKGARTVYITNRGLKDVLTIGRQARRELYNLMPEPVMAPVPDHYLLETGGRLSAQGEIIEDLTGQDLLQLKRELQQLQPESVAINLLFSFLDDRFEKQIANSLPQDLFISCSSDVLGEYREYERGITTWLNAYVGPLVQGYLHRLATQLEPASLSVMRSSGDTCAGEQAGREAVHLMLSGPAGGLAGARHVAAGKEGKRIMTLDMGGTSTDVALIDGEIELTNQGRIAGYPVGVPMVDMHTIGAGGGSIAYVDAGGGLQVGPESAGANPGPACYGRGGSRATVTDANLVLGRLPPTALLGGSLALDTESAYKVMSELAGALGVDNVEAAAEGVIRIANEHMVQALRVISVQRGIDPRDFTLVAFGGAGGLHVCDLADALEIRQAMAPVHAGVLSALGMLVAPAGRQLSRTLARALDHEDEGLINELLDSLSRSGRSALAEEGVDINTLTEKASLDLCYQGQASTLSIPWHGTRSAQQAFHSAHEKRYGHRLQGPVEVVNVRLSLRARPLELELPAVLAGNTAAQEDLMPCSDDVTAVIVQRQQLSRGQLLPGPAVVCDPVSTTYVAPGWQGQIDDYGSLIMQRS